MRTPAASALVLTLLTLACGLSHAQFDALPGQIDPDRPMGGDIGVGLPGEAFPGQPPRPGGSRRPGDSLAGLFGVESSDAFSGIPLGADEARRTPSATYEPVRNGMSGTSGYAGYGGYGTGGYGSTYGSPYGGGYGYGAGSGRTYYGGSAGGRKSARYRDDEKLNINGTASMAYRFNNVTGTVQQFENQWADTATWERNLSLYWRGQLFGPIYSQGNMTMGPYVPTRSDWSVTGHSDHVDVTYGDLSVNIGRSPFARLQKAIAGWEVYAQTDQMQASFFTAGQESRVRRETIQGEGTGGPYRLQFAPIREGTERVRVDDRDFSQRQYNLDYDTGLLTFDEGIIITPSSVIQVTYEEDNRSLTQGRYYGAEMITRVGKTPIGVTWLKQQAPQTTVDPTVSKFFEETFYGNNSTGPFILGRKPIDYEQAIEVFVDGIPRFVNQDWEVNRSSGAIQFYNIIPATATVIIRYYYFDIDEDPTYSRSVIAVDTGFSLDDGAIAASWARSNAGGDIGVGQAYKLRGTYQLWDGRARMDASYISMDPTFTRLESASFERDRKGFDFSIDADVRDDLLVWFDGSRDYSNQGYITGASLGGFSSISTANTGTPFNILTRRWSAGADFTPKSLPSMHYDTSRLRTGSGTAGSSTMRTDSVSISESFGSLSLGAAADQTRRTYTPTQSQQDSTAGSTTGLVATQPEDTLTRQYRINGRVNFRKTDSLSAAYSRNTSRDFADSTGNSEGHTINGTLTMSPVKNMSLTATRRATFSRGAVFLGGTTGGYYGSYGRPSTSYLSGGFGPGGFDSGGSGGLNSGNFNSGNFNSGSFRQDVVSRHALLLPYLLRQTDGDDDEDVPAYADALTDDQSSDFMVDYSPFTRLQLNYGINKRVYRTEGQVGFLADSESFTRSFGAMLRPMDQLTLSANYGRSETTYLNQVYGAVTTDTLSINGDLKLTDGLNLNVGYYRTNAVSPAYSGSGTGSGGGVTIITGSSYSTLTGGISYRLSDKTFLYARGEQTFNRGGFDDSDRRLLIAGFEQGLTDDISVNLGLRYINYASRPTLFGLSQATDYKALTLQAELVARFN